MEYNNSKNKKMKHSLKYNNGYHMIPYTSYSHHNYNDDEEYDEIDDKYNLYDIDNSSGWNILELETLHEIGFSVKNDDTMTCEVDIISLSETNTDSENEKCIIDVYKTNEGYVLKTNKPKRRYIFEKFNEMLNYIEKC